MHYACFKIAVIILLLVSYRSQQTQGIHLSIVPDINAFVIFSALHGTNQSESTIFLQNGCPWSTAQVVIGSVSARRHFVPLTKIQNSECAITFRVASRIISIDRPYVDIVAIADLSILSNIQQTLCISTQLTYSTVSTEPITCIISPFDPQRHSCVIRIPIPYSWFPLRIGDYKRIIILSRSVGTDCMTFHPSSKRTKITLLTPSKIFQSFDLDKRPNLQLTVQTRPNITFVKNSLRTLLIHLNFNDKNMHLTGMLIRLWLDNRLEIVSVSSADSSAWSIRVKSASPPEYHTIFKCQYTAANYLSNYNGFILIILLRMHSDLKDNGPTHEYDDEQLWAHWILNYSTTENSLSKNQMGIKQIKTVFLISPDVPYTVFPLIKDLNLINTAVLSRRQTATSMKVFTISDGGILADVTAASHCLSSEPRVLKTSPTCSSVYVDGSELRGMSKVKVHVHYKIWTTDIELTVWYPKLPITVWVSDSTLSAIRDWQIAVWKWLPGKRKKRKAMQFGCMNKYQQAEVRILAGFHVDDERTGERIYLSGQHDVLFDVTSLAADHVHSSNVGVVSIQRSNSKLLLLAHQPGTARISMRSNIPNIDYGSAVILVTDDEVSVRNIVAEAVVDIEMIMVQSAKDVNQFIVTSYLRKILTHKYQQAVLACKVCYTDGNCIDLSDIGSDNYILDAWSTNEEALAINHHSNKEISFVALENTGNVSVTLQLKSADRCVDFEARPIADHRLMIQLQFDNSIITDNNQMNRKKVENLTAIDVNDRPWQIQILFSVIVISIVLILILYIFTMRGRRPLNDGYEKLVLPILTRLSSSGSCGKDENSHEWIWLSKAQIDGNNSIKSRCSQKSTNDVENSSGTQRSISYKGSEISVFISSQPTVSVNSEVMSRHTTSWRKKPRIRMTNNPMQDSSSEHNLSTYANGFVPPIHSVEDVESLKELNEYLPYESWRRPNMHRRWPGHNPRSDFLKDLRETPA